MSAIDTMDHAHVGNFFDIQKYWVLEEAELKKLTEHPGCNEKINKFFMSVGGGSGEHPALILNNEAIVVKFLNNIVDDANHLKFNDMDYKIHELTEKNQDHYLSLADDVYRWNLDQNQWPLEKFIHVNEEMNKKYKSKKSLQTRMQDAFALFIIYEMPLNHCLKDPQLIEVASLIKTNEWTNVFSDPNILERYVGFEEVTAKAGKVTRNHKTVFGYSLKDWKKETNSIELSEKLTSELSVKSNGSKIKI